MRAYPTWEQFRAKNAQNKERSFETMCRLLFKAKYGIKESLSYAFNNAGNETAPIEIGDEMVGFQAKYFEGGSTIDNSQARQIEHSIQIAHAHYPQQRKVIVYTTLPFGNPPKGMQMTVRQKEVENVATACSITIEWICGDNILDQVAQNELVYDLFFNTELNLLHIDECIRRSNALLVKPIKTKIATLNGEQSIARQDILNQLDGLLAQGKNILLVGESGSGKSAIAKEYYLQHNEGMVAIWINASQFDTDDVNTLFCYEESYTLNNILSYYQGVARKIMFIDSAEKLLNIHNKMPLNLLLDKMREDEWQFVFTLRKSALGRFNNVILNLQEVQVEVVTIPLLNDTNLKTFLEKENILSPANPTLFDRIHNLFYLARYCEIANNNPSSIEEFRELVWEEKIRGSEEHDISVAVSRENSVLDLVRRVLSEGKYFIRKEGIDACAVAELICDEIISEDTRIGYSFTHDIYLEWAMLMYMDILWQRSKNMQAIIQELGDNVIANNYFRRWLQEKIEIKSNIIIEISETAFSEEIDHKWRSAILTEILRSKNYANDFFTAYDYKLKEDDCKLGLIVLSELNVNCQEIVSYLKLQDISYPVMRPIGSGWNCAINFMDSNYDGLWNINPALITSLLRSFARSQGADSNLMRKAGLLALKPHIEIAEIRKNGKDCFYHDDDSPFSLVINYSAYIHEEIKNIINEILANEWVSYNEPYFELTKYIAKAQDISLLHLYIHHPKEVMALWEMYWLASEKDKKDQIEIIGDSRMYEPECAWGLSHERLLLMYFPVSSMQTGMSEMLMFHPQEAVDFMIQFVDKCAKHFASIRWGSDPIEEIMFTMPDGTQRRKFGNQSIWNIYRATSGYAMPDLMHCIHMALENYLLEGAEDKERIGEVKNIIGKILDHAECLSLLAVVASIVTSHVNEFFEEAILLTSNLKILRLDLARCTREIGSSMIEFAYNRNTAMLDERRNSNALPHRKKHLENILFEIQVRYEQPQSESDKLKLEQAYRNVDSLREQLNQIPEEERVLYKFIISRCDVRAMKREVVDVNGVQAIQYTPALDEEQSRLTEKSKKDNEEMMVGVTMRMWVTYRMRGEMDKIKSNPYEHDPLRALADSKKIKKQLEIREGELFLLPGDEYVPSMVCALMLTDFYDKISLEDKVYCEKEVIEALLDVNKMVNSTMSSFAVCIHAIGTMINRTHEYDEQYDIIMRTYAELENEIEGKRCRDTVAHVIARCDLWNTRSELMRNIVMTYLQEKQINHNPNTLTAEDAETVLCLLASYPRDKDMQMYAKICLEIMSHSWDEDDKRKERYFRTNVYAASTVAKIILYAPNKDIPELVAYYSRYLVKPTHDTLIMEFIMCTIMNNLYSKFWIVWRELYKTIIIERNHWGYDELLSNYMLNPKKYIDWGNDWFNLKRENLVLYKNIAQDAGGNPLVLRNVIAVTNSLARKYYFERLAIISDIVSQHSQMKLGELKNEIVLGLQKIIQRVVQEHMEDIRIGTAIRERLLNVLNFMIANGSAYASSIKKTL